ncbi:late competence development ComFB family protein [Metallumcola ferriviriculae]|uniref:Late competence development ComFB family protein n=1 Tax=Metallumcola ferriviriculae TaxID=3039180 RepID=A0AAU0USY4_9FIRM|nr:late competence development ComFB family protein [Desulfitibacteraceae bacterium MK1]
MSKKEVFLKNSMEDQVWTLLDSTLAKSPEMCSCEVCRHDIAALALNLLPPRYVVRDKGEILSRLNQMETQHNTNIVTALTKAMIIVKESPRHASNK